jgi:hypothetical protein
MKFILYIIKSVVFLISFSIITSCGGPTKRFDPDPFENVERWKQQKIKTGEKSVLSKLFGFRDNKQSITGSSLSINPYMWRASLKILSDVPLSSIDSASGIIITDWYNFNNNSNERIKISITIISKEIRADGVQVKTFKQAKNRNGWKNVKVNEENNIKIERAIIKRAALLSSQNQ